MWTCQVNLSSMYMPKYLQNVTFSISWLSTNNLISSSLFFEKNHITSFSYIKGKPSAPGLAGHVDRPAVASALQQGMAVWLHCGAVTTSAKRDTRAIKAPRGASF